MLFKNDHSKREIKKISNTITKIADMRSDMLHKTDDELREMSENMKLQVQSGEKTMDELLPEAFAVVREASRRVTGMEPYPVQLMAGIELFHGKIAEEATGEGKSLVAALPSYLAALEGKGVHVVTVNDYLAKRDADEIGAILRFLGVSVGCVTADMDNYTRRIQYACDVTYVTNNELGFDYLRDNMATSKAERVLRGLHYAIIDEADSILIDEARTPLIISSNSGKPTAIYTACNSFAVQLARGKDLKDASKLDYISGERQEETGDFIVDEKDKIVTLTESGVGKAENFFRIENLADPSHLELQHCINLALRANNLMHKDKDYIVKDGAVLIVDEFTGRIMPGRRFSDGLHQAIEAKERVKIQEETFTSATITFQNFFNKFDKKCGMTGTAATEAKEFREIYKLDVITIPTNKPVIREDMPDAVFKTKAGKYQAVLREIVESHEKGQPVLVGTSSIRSSEELSTILKKAGISHNVLNAKNNELEAQIVAKAGCHGAVTIATNMAGRGTDIKLDEEARSAGGLYVIGTERNESRRIDNQLRGRSGRQGDPGKSRFFISLEDDLLRLFGSEKLISAFNTFGIEDDEEISDKHLTKAIQTAQMKVEANHYGVRKDLLEYDNIMDLQRDTIYKERDEIMDGVDISDSVQEMISSEIKSVSTITDKEAMNAKIYSIFGITPDKIDFPNSTGLELAVNSKFDMITDQVPTADIMHSVMRNVVLKTMDSYWTRNIDNMEQLKQSIRLQAYAQKDPIVEYKLQADRMFDEMISNIRADVVKALFHLKVERVPVQLA